MTTKPPTYELGFFSEPVRAWEQLEFVSRTSNPADPCYVGKPVPKPAVPRAPGKRKGAT